MRPLPYLALALCACASLAQQPPKPKPSLSAAQIIDRSVAATGGRAVMEKLKTTHARGVMEFSPQDAHGSMELFIKAPDKQLLIINLESVGEVRQAVDGATAWSQDAAGNVTETSGAPLGGLPRSTVFSAALKWREQFPKAELMGQETIGGRKAWAIRLTPVTGKPIVRYFDIETYLLLRETGTYDTPQGPMNVRADFSDYREVAGVKAPFLIRQTLPMGEIILRISEMQNNVEIDDARFVKP
jgi:hypothetical protein